MGFCSLETGVKLVDWGRTLFSLSLTAFSILVITVAFVNEKNLFFDNVGWGVQMLILGVDIVVLAMLEGVQIALVGLKNHPLLAFRESHGHAYRVATLVNKGSNFDRFLVGRQIFVVLTVFVAARLTTQRKMDTLFGTDLPEWFQAGFLETGLLGVVVVAIFGQLTPQIIASAYPVDFIQIVPGVYFVCYICLSFESLGVIHFCYKVADFFVWLFGIKSKQESQDVLEDAVATAVNDLNPSNNEEERLQGNTSKNKLQALCSVMDKIAASDNTDYESQIFQLAMQRHPDLFMNFPTINGSKMYKSPLQIVDELREKGYSGQTPLFLRPISDRLHVPPHVFACQVVAQNNALKRAIREAKGDEIGSYDPTANAIERLVYDGLLVSTR